MPEYNALSGGPVGLQIIDPVLSNVARQYRPHGFIYDQIVAPQPVQENVGQYPVFELAKFFAARGEAAVADDAATPLIDFKWGTEFYHCLDYRLRVRLTRKELLQANPALRLEVSKTTGLLGIMALEREKRLATALRSEANGGKLTPTAYKPSIKWDEGTEGSPALIQKDLQNAQKEVYKKIGLRPKHLVITEEIAIAISQDPSVIKIIQYLGGVGFIESGNISGNPNLMTVGGSLVLPKRLWGFNLIVADGVLENAAAEGATPSLSEVWGNTARLLYIDTNAAWGIPTVAYSFRGKVTGGFEQALSQAPAAAGSISQLEPPPLAGDQWAVVDRWQEPDPPAENVRAWECVDEHIVAPEAGIEIEAPLGKP